MVANGMKHLVGFSQYCMAYGLPPHHRKGSPHKSNDATGGLIGPYKGSTINVGLGGC